MALGTLMGAGCDAEDPGIEEFGDSDGSSEGTVVDLDPAEAAPFAGEVIQEVKVGDEKVEFFAHPLSDGAHSISIKSTVPSNRTSSFDALYRENGRLTSLETLGAIAPDATPHPILRDAHEAEARQLGREDLSVHNVDFDALSVQKLTSTQCDWWIFDTSFVGAYLDRGYWGYFDFPAYAYTSNTNQNMTICQENNCDVRRNNQQVMGGCSEGTFQLLWWFNQGSGWTTSSWETHTNVAVRWFMGFSGESQHIAISGRNNNNAYYIKGNQMKFNCTSQLCPILHVDSTWNY